LIGHIHLNLVDDWKVCTELAKSGYVPQLGARTLARVAENWVNFKSAAVYQDSDVEVTEAMNKGSLKRFSVSRKWGVWEGAGVGGWRYTIL